jgi:hypothetical protein
MTEHRLRLFGRLYTLSEAKSVYAATRRIAGRRGKEIGQDEDAYMVGLLTGLHPRIGYEELQEEIRRQGAPA